MNRGVAARFMRRGLAASLALGLALSAAVSTAASEDPAWPSKPLRLIVIVAPGGSADGLGRLVAERLQTTLGQPAIVENKPGANGNIASQFVARSAPDGYTVLLSSNNHAINPSLFANAGYELQDLTPVVELMQAPSLIAVAADSPLRSFDDVIVAARKDPGRLTYGTAGTGGAGHFAMELIKQAVGMDIRHVPYKGGGLAMTDAIGGHLPIVIVSLVAAMPHVQSGRLRPLAVSSEQRSRLLPAVPTVAESGAPGYSHRTWLGLFVPRGTPSDYVDKLNRGVSKILESQDMVERVAEMGGIAGGGPQSEFASRIEAEYAQSKDLIRELKLRE